MWKTVEVLEKGGLCSLMIDRLSQDNRPLCLQFTTSDSESHVKRVGCCLQIATLS